MINIFNIFKKKELQPTVQFYTRSDGLEKIVPPVPASKYIPKWWIDIPKNFQENLLYKDFKGTIKNCPALPDYWKQGYVLPLWTDLYVKIDKDGVEWRTPDKKWTFEFHSYEQYIKWLPDNIRDKYKIIIKPNCPWRIKTPPGYSIYQLPMFYQHNPVFDVLPGTIWSDIHHEINQQMVFKEYGEFTIERGTPLAVYIPYKRTKYNFKITNYTEEAQKWEAKNSAMVRTKFRGAYREEQKRISKCPFHNDN